jgi:hypothetical protein
MRAHSSRRAIDLAIVLLILTACASEGAGASADGAPPTEGGASASELDPTTAAAQPSAAADEELIQDATGVDWSTVDLTTIDWATIDLGSVDWKAVGDNPTFGDLDRDALATINSRSDPGSATLTIGDQTWEFDNFVCAFGYENTESDTFSFTTNSFGEFDGVNTQMQVTIADESGQGRLEGANVAQRIDFDDVSDFENPSIGWRMRATDTVRIDGDRVTAEGVFDDGLTELEAEQIPGTLEATCGDGSRR